MNAIFTKYFGKPFGTIDLLSLDVEGSELNVLRTIDFERFFIGVIVCEMNWKNPLNNAAVHTHLLRHGFKFLHKLQSNRKKKTNADMVYMNSLFDIIYDNMLEWQ